MFPGMSDPRMDALMRAMPADEPPAGGPPDAMGAPPGGDPSAELMDIAMRLESLLPSLDPALAEKISQLLPLLQEGGAPKPQEGPEMGDMGMEGGMDLPL